MSEQYDKRDSFDDEAPIVAVDFTPIDAERRSFALQLSPARIAVGAALLLFAGAGWFVLSARSVFFDLRPAGGDISVSGGLAVQVGPRYLVRAGDIAVRVSAPGYQDFNSVLTVGSEQAQTFAIELQPLPGFLALQTNPPDGVEVSIDGEVVGTTPLANLELAAGEHTLTFSRERYEPQQADIFIEGRQTTQELAVELLPAWAEVSISSTPPGATVSVDGVDVGSTPLTAELLAGEREVLVKLPAHKAWSDTLRIRAREDQTLPPIALEPADGLVLLRSTPSGASVTINGSYRGLTPLELTLPPTSTHQLVFFLNGYQEARRDLRTQAEGESSINVTLEPIVNSVRISATPADAEVWVNGEFKGNANQTLELLAASQTIEIRREGYVPYSTSFVSRPGLDQVLNVQLKTLQQQAVENIKPEIKTAAGQTLKLVYPGSFTMGSSRREAGRQANEVLRNVTLTKPFYLSLHEVTNAQFQRFDPEHLSGVVEGQSLGNPSQPVARVTWEQAALYCNWLSEQEGLPPFYQTDGDSITGFNPDSTGYRLPSEAEWEWVARVDGDPAMLRRFPWGEELPPPPRAGNFADVSTASFLGRVLLNYNDGFLGSAPVGSFEPNQNGFYDIGGNVAEWVHDFYGAGGLAGSGSEVDPLGPTDGVYHVIRGSSWAQGAVTELRLAFRDYNNVARDDVGFRVARYLGLP
jgi:formylglycine-generating enzyme required for sulfatase activity